MATEENFPSFARDIQPLSQVWQPWASSGMRSTGKKDATRWRLTSLGIPTILMVLDAVRGGCGAVGGSTLVAECLGQGERLQALPLTSSL
jgi:hypothetical protein